MDRSLLERPCFAVPRREQAPELAEREKENSGNSRSGALLLAERRREREKTAKQQKKDWFCKDALSLSPLFPSSPSPPSLSLFFLRPPPPPAHGFDAQFCIGFLLQVHTHNEKYSTHTQRRTSTERKTTERKSKAKTWQCSRS